MYVSTSFHGHLEKSSCSRCGMSELCLPLGLTCLELERLEKIMMQRFRVKKGVTLYRALDPLNSLYAVRIGSFKTSVMSVDGREQVTGFQMSGEMLGLDAISKNMYASNAVALEDSEVCPIQFSQLEKLAHELPSLQHNLNRILSREIVRDHEMLAMLGTMSSEERFAAFLVNISDRLHNRGFSSSKFILKMRREEIGSYLGLRLETVCRAISYLRDHRLVAISGRDVKILDIDRLAQLGGAAADLSNSGKPENRRAIVLTS